MTNVNLQTVTYPASLRQRTPIYPSLCGADKHLSIAGAFSLLVDAAAVHSEEIGTGCREMAERGQFWLMTHARIRFYRRPTMMEPTMMTTWPRQPRHYLCDRFFLLSSGDETLLEGRQEWAVLDRESGHPIRTEGVYPAELSPPEVTILDTPFLRMRDTLTEADHITTATVTAADIDFGNHLSNAKYWRFLCDTFTVQEQGALAVKEAEIAYLAPCYEGERLTILRRHEENRYLFAVRKEDGKAAALACLTA